MKDKPIVSICCIAYNHSKFIQECLEGFEKQKVNFLIEIIIHDDLSSDNTRDLLIEYQKKSKFTVKLLFPNYNRYSKGEKLFIQTYKEAKGKYIAICEGDDYWTDPYKLQKQVDFLESNPDFVITSHNAVIIDDKGIKIKDYKLNQFEDRVYSQEELKQGAFLLTLTLMFRNVIKVFPPETNLITNGDTFLISLLGCYGKGYFNSKMTPDVYRRSAQGIWSMKGDYIKLKTSFESYAFMSSYYKRIKDFETHNNIVKKLKSLYTGLLRYILKNELKYFFSKVTIRFFILSKSYKDIYMYKVISKLIVKKIIGKI